MQDLGTLPGGNKSGAIAINASGQVLGFSNAPDGKSHIVEWDPKTGALYSITLDLGPGVATDINVLGDVLGTKDGAPRSSLWKRLPDGTPMAIDVGSLGGKATDYTDAQNINDFEEIVGETQTAAGAFDAFLLKSQSGSMTDLNGLNGGLAGPLYINNLAEVACALMPTPHVYTVAHAALVRPGQPVLDLTPSSTYAYVNGINNVGQIVGTSGQGATTATVLWGPDGKVLGTLPITGVRGFNDAGQLMYNDNQNHAFLLTPVGGKTLTGPETDNALGLIGNLIAELPALPAPSQEEARDALTSIGGSLVGAEAYLKGGLTLCAVGNLEGAIRIMKARLPPEAGGTPERINRLKALITRLGGNPDV